MRLFGAIMAVALLLPASVPAQSVKPADLVGVWANRLWMRLYVRADSTFSFQAPDSVVGGKQYHSLPRHFVRWNYLRGDTISWHGNGPCLTGEKTGGLCGKPNCRMSKTDDDCYVGEPGFLITLEERAITFMPLGKTTKSAPVFADHAFTRTYRRVSDPERLISSIDEP